MKRLLSIFSTISLISISSLQLVSCNYNKTNKDIVENKESEQKDDSNDNKNKDNGDNTNETKPLTAKQVADKIVKEFENKKVTFLNQLKSSKPNTVADFYNVVENEFNVKKEEHIENKITIINTNYKDPLSKEKEPNKKIYVGNYNILIEIEVTRIREDNSIDTQKRKISFEYVIPAPVIELTPKLSWTRQVPRLAFGKDVPGGIETEVFPLSSNWEKWNIDLETYYSLYSKVEIDYTFTFKGYISEIIKAEDLKKEATLEEAEFDKWYTSKDTQSQDKVWIGAHIGISQDYHNRNTIELSAYMYGENTGIEERQSVTIEINKIKLIPKK